MSVALNARQQAIADHCNQVIGVSVLVSNAIFSISEINEIVNHYAHPIEKVVMKLSGVALVVILVLYNDVKKVYTANDEVRNRIVQKYLHETTYGPLFFKMVSEVGRKFPVNHSRI